LELVMEKQNLFAEALKCRLDDKIHSSRIIAGRHRGALPAYDRLVSVVRARSSMLARRSLLSAGPDVDASLLAMALHHADWLAPVESWTHASDSTHAALASLAEHLFARYPMPRFMASAWLGGEPGSRMRERGWYKFLGAGGNVRRAGIPMRITRAMAHRFLGAPDHLSPIAALRWAQVVTLAGDRDAGRLACAILDTRLGRAIDDAETEALWESVVVFFLRHPEIDLGHVGPIVDFLQHPLHRGMTVKGRTPASLLKQVEEWHTRLGSGAAPLLRWPRASIRDFSWREKPAPRGDDGAPETRLWTITELCSSDHLVAEGRAMRHCVATYAEACVRRRSSIWSVQVETRQGRARVMTVEVEPGSRRVQQARGKRNAAPSDAAKVVLARWADRERLEIPEGLRV
jgi:PcfJ-like protein